MPDGISQEQFDKLKDELAKMKKELENTKKELKKQTDERTAKQQLAKKLGAIAELEGLIDMDDLPSPERLAELNELLEENINWLLKFLKAALEILRTIIEGIIKALQIFWDFLKSLFPEEETETAMVGDQFPEGGQYVAFATVAGLGENIARTRFPRGFAGLEDDVLVTIRPASVRMDILVGKESEGIQCIKVASFAAVSHPIKVLNKTVPPMVQTLDPRMPSGGFYVPETGEVHGRLFTRAFDGTLYAPSNPIVIRGRFDGRIRGGHQPVLEVKTKSIDFLSDTPLRRLFCMA